MSSRTMKSWMPMGNPFGSAIAPFLQNSSPAIAMEPRVNARRVTPVIWAPPLIHELQIQFRESAVDEGVFLRGRRRKTVHGNIAQIPDLGVVPLKTVVGPDGHAAEPTEKAMELRRLRVA